MAFKKGQSGNPSGRRKGSSNRVNKAVKDALLEALNDGAGAMAFFKRLKNGTADDRRCFANICSKMIPHEITGSGGATLFPDPDKVPLLEVARRMIFVLESARRKSRNEPYDTELDV